MREGATQTIELGLGYGISALHICEGSLENADPRAHHVAIDLYQESRFSNCGLQSLEKAGVADLVEYHAQESQIKPQLSSSEGRSCKWVRESRISVSTKVYNFV